MKEKPAIKAITPAIQCTRSLIWPLRVSRWFRLMIISFFIGTWLTGPFPDISIGNFSILNNISGFELFTGYAGIISSVIASILMILLVFAFIGSVFQFIFVDYLASNKKGLIQLFKNRWHMGIRLFIFNLIMLFIVAIFAGATFFFIATPILNTDIHEPYLLMQALAYTLIGLFILIIPVWILTLITNDFVVPVMMVRNSGIINGWKIIIKEFKGRWRDIFLYIIIKMVIYVTTGIILGFILLIVGLILGTPSVILIPGFSGTISYGYVPILISTLLMTTATLIVMTPLITFLRIYSLIFLKELSISYSILPDAFLDITSN